MPTVSIDIKNTGFNGWTRLYAPTVDAPYWRDDGGAAVGYAEITAGLAEKQRAEIDEIHLAAITEIARAGITLARGGRSQHGAARATITATKRLLDEVIGMSPASSWAPAA
ncbi:MAG: hypothetical protein JHD16_00330 [Solirubrobacteraceae bacterium]|nr:hypothetical protein [Solirubrobacteraceae bacterium]